MKRIFIPLLTITLLFACKKEDTPTTPTLPFIIDPCPPDPSLAEIDVRKFLMGFSTWPFGPTVEAVETTNTFIKNNADIISEHIDDKIPWDAWINNTALPQKFVDDINFRASRKSFAMKRLISVSLLNTLRTDLAEDLNGSTPTYTALNDQTIEDAYVKHLSYIIDQLEPDYFVMTIEANELYKNSTTKWDEYKLLMANVRSRLKAAYPTLPLSESLTLHNWYTPDAPNPTAFINELNAYTNNLDFVSISFYPFFKGQKSKADFQKAFDFLHSSVSKPIAFVETTHIAENLVVNGLNLNIPGNSCEQKAYLETLLLNAHRQDYLFVIWWAHRDFDVLWETFPDELKDLGKLWRDTGLLDQNGNARPAYTIWKTILNK